MDYIPGNLNVSRFILGSIHSAFSTKAQIWIRLCGGTYHSQDKRAPFSAEGLGVNTLIARRIIIDCVPAGVLGRRWPTSVVCSTCPEIGDHPTCVARAIAGGAKACHIHGGVMDFLYAQDRLDEIPSVIRMIRDNGLQAVLLLTIKSD